MNKQKKECKRNISQNLFYGTTICAYEMFFIPTGQCMEYIYIYICLYIYIYIYRERERETEREREREREKEREKSFNK